MVMTKDDMATYLANELIITKDDAKAAISAMTSFITDSNAKGEKVQLIGFGSFEPHHRTARNGVNPNTKEPIVIPAQIVPKFTAGKKYRDKLNSNSQIH